MGNIAVDRQTWAKAIEYKRRWEKYEKEGGDPPVRDLAWRLLKNRIVMATSFSSGFRARGRDRTIDLDDSDYSRGDDYKRGPDHNSPWRRLKDD